jgi:protoporphyrinogen oxidase
MKIERPVFGLTRPTTLANQVFSLPSHRMPSEGLTFDGLNKSNTPVDFQKPAQNSMTHLFSVLFSGKKLKDRVERHVPVVVVGGGMAGLIAMYELTKKHSVNAVLLESQRKMGGNSQSDVSKQGIQHPTGATIFIPGSEEHMAFWKEIGVKLDPKYLLKPEIYIDNNERFTAFSNDETQTLEHPPTHPQNIKAAKGFQKMLNDLKKIAGKPKSAPMLPIQQATEKSLTQWDGMSLSKYLKPFGRLVKRLAEPYIQSDLAASSRDVSAYVGMMDLEDLNNPRYVQPGGNGYIIKQLVNQVHQATGFKPETSSPETNPLQPEHVVEKIIPDGKRTLVKFRDAENKIRVISADHVLLATPYHKVPSLLEVPKKEAKIMRALPKSSYSIVNIFLKNTPLKTYQFYMTPNSKHIADLFVAPKNTTENREPNESEPSVMSIYTPHTGRVKDQEAFGQSILEEIKQTFPEITDANVDGVRVNPFKFSMAAPKPGQVKTLKELPRTYGNVTLINSDGGAIPSLLTALEEAKNGVAEAMKTVKAREAEKVAMLPENHSLDEVS